MYPALSRLLDVDPAEVETADLATTLERRILERKLPAAALSNSLHGELVKLETEGQLGAPNLARLHVTWVLGR